MREQDWPLFTSRIVMVMPVVKAMTSVSYPKAPPMWRTTSSTR